MAKKSKDELKKSIDENIEDVDKKISMLEDIEDSVDAKDVVEKSEFDELTTKYNELETKYTELQTKYKDRFFSNDAISPDIVSPVANDKGLKEINYVDIKEI